MDTVTAELDSLDLNKDIAPDGDVILVVGPEKTQLRVYSQCLRSASTIFSDLLKSELKEDKALSGKNPPLVQLPVDNAEALELVCSILHHRNEEAPTILPPSKVLDVAMIAEKYQLSMALRYARMNWMDPRKTWSTQDTLYIMTAASAFDDDKAFTARSLELIMNYGGNYMDLRTEKIWSTLIQPASTLCMHMDSLSPLF